MKLFLKATVAAAALCVLGSASPASADTLEEAITKALDFNPRIKAASSNKDAIGYELRQSRSYYLPQADLRAGAGIARYDDLSSRNNFGGSVDGDPEELSLILQQRIFDGYEADSLVARDKARVTGAARRVYESSEFLGLDVTEAYLDMLRAQKVLDLSVENAQIHENILSSLQERGRGGVGSFADIAQTEARLLRAESAVEDAQNQLLDAQAAYIALVGDAPASVNDVTCPTAALPADEQETLAQLVATNPTVRALDADVDANEARVDLSESTYYPKVNLEANASHFDEQDGALTYEDDVRLMVMMRWNLYSGGRDMAAEREASSRLGQSKFERSVALLQAEEETRRAWNSLRSAERRSTLLADAVVSSVETRDAYREQFLVGDRTLLDVLDAENEVYVVSTELVDAETVRCFQQFAIIALTGSLLQTVGVEVPASSSEEIPSFAEMDFIPK
jgi:adhesin transport system outer membrane protein